MLKKFELEIQISIFGQGNLDKDILHVLLKEIEIKPFRNDIYIKNCWQRN